MSVRITYLPESVFNYKIPKYDFKIVKYILNWYKNYGNLQKYFLRKNRIFETVVKRILCLLGIQYD